MALFLSALLKPFVLLAFLGGLLAVRWTLQRWLPEGRLKRALLFDLTHEIEHPQGPAPPAKR